MASRDTAGEVTVRRAAPGDAEELARILARAFQDDVLTRWILPDEDRRRATLPAVYAVQLRTWYLQRAVTDVAERAGRVVGCALWNPPDRPSPPPLVQLRQLSAALRMGGRGLPRLLAASSATGAARPTEPHWYLAELATDPEVQGTGVGSQLVRHGLARADADRVPAYLESPDDNIDFYRRFDFIVAALIPIRSGPTAYGMRRAPG
ncbi:MAG: GNAT family N-acetyltransferase [Pseudonocardia sp.]